MGPRVVASGVLRTAGLCFSFVVINQYPLFSELLLLNLSPEAEAYGDRLSLNDSQCAPRADRTVNVIWELSSGINHNESGSRISERDSVRRKSGGSAS